MWLVMNVCSNLLTDLAYIWNIAPIAVSSLTANQTLTTLHLYLIATTIAMHWNFAQ
jgi:hypothetical protein